MKKILPILILFLLSCNSGFSQQKDKNNSTINCETKFKELSKKFKEKDSLLKLNNSFISSLKQNITKTNLKKMDSTLTLNVDISKKLDSIYTKFKNYKVVCIDLGLKETLIDSLFPHQKPKKIDEELQQETETQTFLYFNKNQIIKEEVFNNKTIQGKILNDVLSQTNQKTYLGDITIPKDNEKFFFYEQLKGEKALSTTKESYEFKKIEIQIKDGNFSDIKVTVNYNGKPYVFENYAGVSFFRFRTMARRNYLFYSSKNTGSIDDDEMGKFRVRLSDILDYDYKMGNHYLPKDLVLELPKKDIENEQTNINVKPTYKIKEDTYLDKIIELRAYSDFLALFSDNSNGLLQIEGNAKFYIFPFSRQFFNTSGQYELFKSVTPYVHYSRFESEDKPISITNNTFDNELSLIEKRFLEMGVHLNVFEFYHKNYPLKANIFGSLNYNLTEIQNADNSAENIKSLGYGIGLNIASKRFNNFGFNYSVKAEWFDFKNSNVTNTVNTNINIPVLNNQAEIFYHPTESSNQAIFMRLGVYNYMGDSSNNAFYQFQFGYKFSIGSRTITKE